jgi:hypothetical protein
MKTVTKKQIQVELRKQTSTAIFAIAKRCGVDVTKRVDVMRFVEANAPTQKIYKSAFRIALCADHANQLKTVHNSIDMPIANAVQHAKQQVNDSSMSTNYGKILIEGNNNIYWASPSYGHSDYNKSVAFKNTDRNRKAMDLINSMLRKSIVAKAA